ncbi:hypothetical protein Esti_006562 [Eimeria stiedai]
MKTPKIHDSLLLKGGPHARRSRKPVAAATLQVEAPRHERLSPRRFCIPTPAFKPGKQLELNACLNGANLSMMVGGDCRRGHPPWGHVSRPARTSRWRFVGFVVVVVAFVLCSTAESDEGFLKDVFGRLAFRLSQRGPSQQQPLQARGIFSETSPEALEQLDNELDSGSLYRVEDVGEIGSSSYGDDNEAWSPPELRSAGAPVWDERPLKTQPFFGVTRNLQEDKEEGKEEEEKVEAAATTRTRPARGTTRSGRETTGSRTTRGATDSRSTRSATGSRTTRGGSGGSTSRGGSTTRTGITTKRTTATTRATTTKSEPVLLGWREVDEGPLDALKNDDDLTSLAKQMESSPVAQGDSIITRLAITLFAPTDDALSQLTVKLEELSKMVRKLKCSCSALLPSILSILRVRFVVV